MYITLILEKRSKDKKKKKKESQLRKAEHTVLGSYGPWFSKALCGLPLLSHIRHRFGVLRFHEGGEKGLLPSFFIDTNAEG